MNGSKAGRVEACEEAPLIFPSQLLFDGLTGIELSRGLFDGDFPVVGRFGDASDKFERLAACCLTGVKPECSDCSTLLTRGVRLSGSSLGRLSAVNT